jgi:transcription initiation factor TFIIIB Brf1 subunit/transcription initiation factor TFIIB
MGELIRKDTGEDVSSDNTLSQEKEWHAFELEGDISRARTEAPTSLAFHDMGVFYDSTRSSCSGRAERYYIS